MATLPQARACSLPTQQVYSAWDSCNGSFVGSSRDSSGESASAAKRRRLSGAIPHRVNKEIEMKLYKQAMKYGSALALTAIGTAHAAVPANVQTALDGLSADAVTVAGIVLAAVVAVFAFKFIRKGL
jgi:Inovirus Coat protein B